MKATGRARTDRLRWWDSPLRLTAFALFGLLGSGCVWLEVVRLNRMDLTEFRVEGSRLYMAREINSRTLDQFLQVMESAPQVKTLVMTVVPGSVDDEVNLQLGLEVRRRGLATYLVSGGLIASGGVDLYLAGGERTMEPGAFVGVHSWAAGFGKTGASVEKDHPNHQLYLRYYDEIGISADFYWFTLEAAPADGMHWMSLEELERYRVITQPLVATGGEYTGPFAEDMLELKREAETRLDGQPIPVTLDRKSRSDRQTVVPARASPRARGQPFAHLMRLGVLPTGYIYPQKERPVRDLLLKRAKSPE